MSNGNECFIINHVGVHRMRELLSVGNIVPTKMKYFMITTEKKINGDEKVSQSLDYGFITKTHRLIQHKSLKNVCRVCCSCLF